MASRKDTIMKAAKGRQSRPKRLLQGEFRRQEERSIQTLTGIAWFAGNQYLWRVIRQSAMKRSAGVCMKEGKGPEEGGLS